MRYGDRIKPPKETTPGHFVNEAGGLTEVRNSAPILKFQQAVGTSAAGQACEIGKEALQQASLRKPPEDTRPYGIFDFSTPRRPLSCQISPRPANVFGYSLPDDKGISQANASMG